MRSEGFSILAAVVLHGGLIAVARMMPPPSLVTSADLRQLQTIDIEIPTALPAELREPPRPMDPVTPAPKREADSAPDPRLARAAPTIGGAPRPDETATPETNPPPAPTATQRPTQFDDLPPDQRQGVLGVQGVPGLGNPVYTMPGVLPPDVRVGAPAPTVAPAPRPVDRDIAGKIIRDAMASKDKEIGLDIPVAGSIRTAVKNAVMASDIPTGSKGSVTCTVSPTGVVSNCRLRSSTGGGAESWAVATRAAAAVAGSTLPGNYAHGAIVTIDISVVQTPPAGSKGGLSGAGASFDISNIGAHATRNVRTSHSVVALP